MLENAGDLGAFCNPVKERDPVLGPKSLLTALPFAGVLEAPDGASKARRPAMRW